MRKGVYQWPLTCGEGGPYAEASAVNMYKGTAPPHWNESRPPSSPRSDPLQLLLHPPWKEAIPLRKQQSSRSGMTLLVYNLLQIFQSPGPRPPLRSHFPTHPAG